MNVLFFCHEDFACNSMGHIAGFAAGLRALGHDCAAAIPGDDRSSVGALGATPPFRPLLFSETWEKPARLFANGRGADIVHAWTPRENVRRAVQACRQAMPGSRLIVHLEDNEEYLLSAITGTPFADLQRMPDAELAERLPVNLSHPREYRRFLESADGVTGIVQALAEFAPPGKPFIELWPGVDFTVYRPATPAPGLRAELGLRPAEKVICYPGNTHFANREELQRLYDAVFLLNRRGRACRLIRTGCDTVPFPIRSEPGDLEKCVIALGFVDRERLPDLLRVADALVQPGADNAFNRYRLPSKVPEFLASGRPVLLPRANVGLKMRPGLDALLLETGTAEEIAAMCETVFADPAFAERLAAGAAAFAQDHFRVEIAADRLDRFYRRLRSRWGRWFG